MKNIKLVTASLLSFAGLALVACEPSDWSSHDYDGVVYVPQYSSSSSGYYGSSGNQRRPPSDTNYDAGPFDPPSYDYDPSCLEPSGFGGRGCFKCEPHTSEELLNACTTSRFEAFENGTRIGNFIATDPTPKPPHLDPSPPPYEGGSTDPTDPLPPAPPCPIATKPNPVMIVGATGFPLETIAKAMGTNATIFYREKSSCDGVASVLLSEAAAGEAVYYDADGTKNRCTLTESRPADIGLSALFAETCSGEAGLANPVVLPDDVKDFLGPASTVMFAVPATSNQRAISAEAAYRVYGFGIASLVDPWTDEYFIFRRGPTSGNQQTIARSLGLPADAFRGRDSNGSSNMLNALRDSKSPSKTIGISSSEIVDVNRDVVKSLASATSTSPSRSIRTAIPPRSIAATFATVTTSSGCRSMCSCARIAASRSPSSKRTMRP